MATETLSVNLLLNAGQYKREAAGAASATGKIAGSAQMAGTQTSRLDRQLGATGITMRTAVVSGSLVAGAAVLGFAKDTVAAASNLQESINAVNVVFGEAADGVHEIGESAADSFGLSQRAFNEFAVRFSAFAEQIADQDGRSVVAVVEEMTGRVADFASVHNLSLEEAARVAQSTLAGETEVFRRFGGDVSAATVQQYALEAGVIEAGESLTEQQKILVRHRLFMEQTEKTAGDFANTQDDLANATRTLSANFEDFKARAGGELLPVMGELASQGVQLFDVLDPDVDLGWTQRLSAGIQLVTGEGSEAVKTYIEQKTALNELEGAAEDAENPIAGVGRASGSSAGEIEIFGKEASIAAGSTDIFAGGIDRLFDELDDQGGAWDDVITSMEEYETTLRRLTDPVFRAIDDQRRLEEATQKYLDVVDDPDATVGEHEQAMWDLVAAEQAVGESSAELPDDLKASADSIEILGRRAGITEDDLRRLRDQILEFDGLSANATIGINVVGGERISGIDMNRQVTLRQHGGPVSAGHPYVVGEAGPELFIPQSSGMVLSNAQSTSAGSPVGGTVVNNYFALTWGEFLRKSADAGLEIQRYGW